MGKTHVAIGLAAATFIGPMLRWPGLDKGLFPFAFSIGAVAIGSLAPDLDQPGSELPSKVAGPFGKSRIAAFIGGAAAIYFSSKLNVRLMGYDLRTVLGIIGIILLIMAFIKHRGVTHSLVGAAVAGFAVLALENLAFYQHYIGVPILLPFMVGYITHLMADFFSGRIGGIAPLYPFVEKRILPPFAISDGGIFDKLIIRYLAVFLAVVRIFNVV